MQEKYGNGVPQQTAPTYPQMPTGTTPRTLNPNTFGNNTVVNSGFQQQTPGYNQVAPQAPDLSSGSPF